MLSDMFASNELLRQCFMRRQSERLLPGVGQLFKPLPKCHTKGRDTVGEPPSKFQAYFFLGTFPQLFCLPRRHVGYTSFGTFEFANSIGRVFETPSTVSLQDYFPFIKRLIIPRIAVMTRIKAAQAPFTYSTTRHAKPLIAFIASSR